MSGWQELRAERNQRSLVRHCLLSFHVSCSVGLSPALSCRRRRGLRSNHTGALIQFGRIAWREHSQLAAKRPIAGVGGSETAGAACLSRSAPHLHRSMNMRTHSGLDFAACAVNRFIDSAGTLTLGRRSQQECGVAQQFWNSPSTQIRLWRRLQSRRYAETGGRLWRNASKTPTELYAW